MRYVWSEYHLEYVVLYFRVNVLYNSFFTNASVKRMYLRFRCVYVFSVYIRVCVCVSVFIILRASSYMNNWGQARTRCDLAGSRVRPCCPASYLPGEPLRMPGRRPDRQTTSNHTAVKTHTHGCMCTLRHSTSWAITWQSPLICEFWSRSNTKSCATHMGLDTYTEIRRSWICNYVRVCIHLSIYVCVSVCARVRVFEWLIVRIL